MTDKRALPPVIQATGLTSIACAILALLCAAACVLTDRFLPEFATAACGKLLLAWSVLACTAAALGVGAIAWAGVWEAIARRSSHRDADATDGADDGPAAPGRAEGRWAGNSFGGIGVLLAAIALFWLFIWGIPFFIEM